MADDPDALAAAARAGIPQKPKRKLPFKATALHQNGARKLERTISEEDALALFQRRDEMLPAFEEEAKRQARKTEAARQASITPKKEQAWQSELDSLKRRLSLEDGVDADAPESTPERAPDVRRESLG